MTDERGVNLSFLKLNAPANQNKYGIKIISLAKTTPLYLSYQAPYKVPIKTTNVTS